MKRFGRALLVAPLACAAFALAATPAPGQEPAALPPVDPSLALSETENRLDDVLRARVQPIEDRIRELESSFATASTADRIRLLEEKVSLLENLSQAQRARDLGILRTKFTHGYKLVGDMQTKAAGLKASATISSAYDAIIGLTDLRQYAGFQATFDHLVQRVNSNERPWLRQLLGSAIPSISTGVMGLGTVAPVLSMASVALEQLKYLVPALVRNHYSGAEFVNRYNTLSCGLQQVGQLHNDLISLASTNTIWAERVSALDPTYASALADYRTAVGLSGPVSDATFYGAVEARFNQAASSGADEYLRFADNVGKRNSEFEASARRYHAAVLQHIEYWQRTRDILERGRDAPCLQSDQATRMKYDAAVARVDQVIRDLGSAYLFNGNDRPENEYFRSVTQAQ